MDKWVKGSNNLKNDGLTVSGIEVVIQDDMADEESSEAMNVDDNIIVIRIHIDISKTKTINLH